MQIERTQILSLSVVDADKLAAQSTTNHSPDPCSIIRGNLFLGGFYIDLLPPHVEWGGDTCFCQNGRRKIIRGIPPLFFHIVNSWGEEKAQLKCGRLIFFPWGKTRLPAARLKSYERKERLASLASLLLLRSNFFPGKTKCACAPFLLSSQISLSDLP